MNCNILKAGKSISLLAFLLSLSLTAQAQQSIDERRDASAQGRISFAAVTGDFEVIGHDETSFRLVGTLGEDVEELIISGDADDWRIQLEAKDGNYDWRDKNATSELTLYVPLEAELKVNVVSADLAVSDLIGERLEVASVSGDIDISDAVPQALEAKSVSGDVYVEGGGQRESSLASVSGDVDADELRGRVSAESVSGDVTLEAMDVSDLQVESVSGDLDLIITPMDRATLELSTHSGDIDLALPDGTQMDLEASSFSGDMSNAFGGEVMERVGPGEEMEFRSGNGGVRIKAQTFSGELMIERQY